MKKIVTLIVLALPLFSAPLTLKEGFIAAHTEMAMDSTIDPMATHLRTDLTMDGDIVSLKGTISVNLTDFSSDNSGRDENMQESLESAKFVAATYTIGSVEHKDADNYLLKGTMDFHGVQKEMAFDGEITESGEGMSISVKSSMLISDFGIEMPCMMFLCVRDQVDIFAKVVLEK